MKVWRGLLALDGTNVVVTVLENSLGGNIVWTRSALGQYGAFLANGFPVDKTMLRVTPVAVSDVDGTIAIWIDPASLPDGFQVNVTAGGQFTDQVMQMGQVPVEILVYG